MAKLKNLLIRTRGKKGVPRYAWFCNKKVASKYGVPQYQTLGTEQHLALQQWKKYHDIITSKRRIKKDVGFLPLLANNSELAKGSLAYITELYLKSRHFQHLAKRTQEDYIRYCNNLNYKIIVDGQAKCFCTKQIATFDRVFCLNLYERLLAKGVRVAGIYMQTLSQIINTAINNGYYMFDNPCFKIQMEHNKPRNEVWTKEEFDKFISSAINQHYHGLVTAMMLGFYTAQRQTDILNMQWSWFTNDLSYLKFQQSKTGSVIEIPIFLIKELHMFLTKLKQTQHGVFLVTDPADGLPYTNRRRLFGNRFEEIRKKSDIRKDLLFRDLRRTSILHLQEKGCTPEQIASISGHSLRTIYAMLDVYAPKTRLKAEQALRLAYQVD